VTIQILDIYQGNKFNAQREAATGTDAVLIKGGQGQYHDYIEHKCKYVEDCIETGLPWGIFWQMDARYSPESHKAAIKEFHDLIGFGELGLWLACEKPFYPCPDWMYSRMPFAFYKPIESVWRGITAYTGKAPGIYTSPSMWKLIFGQCPKLLQAEFALKSELWVAQYEVDKPDQIGQWALGYWFWQYTAEPDYSVFCGDEDSFRIKYKLEAQIPEPDVPSQPPAPTDDEEPLERNTVLDEAIEAIEKLKDKFK
jgi:hypothetical protein